VFLMCGLTVACWASLVPFAKARLGLPDSALGLILLALGSGAMVAMPASALLIHRIGSRAVVRLSGLLVAGLLPLLTLAPDGVSLAVLLGLFGAALGALDVAMNAQAVIVEAASRRPLMSSFHALYSLGGLAGALAISLLLRLGCPIDACICGGAALVAAAALQSRGLLPPDADEPDGAPALALPRAAALLIGLLCFIAFLTEGAVLDWSGVLLRFSRGVPEASANLGYAGFSLAMVAARFGGDRLMARFGPRRMVRAGAALAALGLLLAVGVDAPAVDIGGFVCVGLGAANIVPALFGAAGRLPGVAAHVAISSVTTLGYAGLLAGPTAIGFAARLVGLPGALAGVALLLAGLAAGAGRLPARQPAASASLR
jgi:predicted MFS family arabinose efflux permease